MKTLLAATLLLARADVELSPYCLGQPGALFCLPELKGGQVDLAERRGRNLLLVFPRGRVEPDRWCQACHYQYLELVRLEERTDFRKRYRVDVVFVLPYAREQVQAWSRFFPEQMGVIEAWKRPGSAPPGVAGWHDPTGLRWAHTARTFFPRSLAVKPGEDVLRFPVLVDADARVSRALGLFRASWGGTLVEQNQPTVVLLDPAGTVRFKYHSQTTFDRPDGEYLLGMLAHFAPAD